MAAGALNQTPGEWFGKVVPGTEIVRPGNKPLNGALAEADGRHVVVVTRDAHRHERTRDAIEELVARFPDLVLVELGLPVLAPERRHLRRDLRRGPRERGSRSRGAILGLATRGGAVW